MGCSNSKATETATTSDKKVSSNPIKVLPIKLGCVVRIVFDSLLPHAEFGRNDPRKNASWFMFQLCYIPYVLKKRIVV